MSFSRNGIRTCVVATIVFLGFVVASVPAGADDPKPMKSPFTPSQDGQAQAHCVCVAATTGCLSMVLWKLEGKPSHDWWQTIHLTAGKEVDLGLACYRKRDVDDKGAGMCCVLPVAPDDEPDPADVNKLFGVIDIKYDS